MSRRRASRVAACCAALIAVVAAAGCGSGESNDAAPAVPADFYGVMAQGPIDPEDVEQMAASGVGTLRVFVPWSALDPGPEPGDIQFAAVDQIVGEAARHEIEVLPYLLGSPDWVAGLDGADCENDCAIHAPASPAGLAEWREFVAAVAGRYGPGGTFWDEHPELAAAPVREWQIWNEQNSPSFYAPRPDVEAYARLLGAAAEEIRALDPEASVIVGGMAESPLQGRPPAFTAPDFLRRLYAVPGARESFDAVAAHAYAAHPEGVVEQIEALREEIVRAGDDAPLWVTEIGWSSAEGSHPLKRGPEGQAENLAAAFELLAERRREWDLRGVVWFAWRDYTAAHICEWCAQAGLFEELVLEPKPAAEAFAGLPRSG